MTIERVDATEANIDTSARETLYEIIRQDVPFKQKANEVLELGKQYFGVENGHLTQIDQETNHWEIIASTDIEDSQFPPGLTLDLDTTYCSRVIDAEAPVSLWNAAEQGWEDDPVFKQHGLNCYHGTRLIVDHEPYGTICFVSQGPREPFEKDDRLLIELMARLLERELERDQHEAALTRQTNLSNVLNRVLRHNLRNDMSIVRGYTQLMSDELGSSEYANISLRTIDDLLTLSEKARDLERFVTGDFERNRLPIGPLIEQIADELGDEFPDAAITVDTSEEEPTAEILSHFSRAIHELIHNAIRYGGDPPVVKISVEPVPQAVEIKIEDNGSGISSDEAEVLKAGSETPLIHGSGLGLWIAHWIISSHGGSIDATTSDSGTTMTVSVPRDRAMSVTDQLTKLTQARDQYQAAFEKARDAMVIVNDDAQIIDANRKAEELYGMGTPKILGQSLTRFFPEDFDFEAFWEKSHEKGTDLDTMTLSGADGVTRTVEYSAANKIVPGQTLIISRDITDRAESQRAVQTNNRLLEVVLQSSPAPTFVLDHDGRVKLWNAAAGNLFGSSDENVVGHQIGALAQFSEETAQKLLARLQQQPGADSAEDIEITVRNDDAAVPVSLITAQLTGETGEFDGLIVTAVERATSRQRSGESTDSEQPVELARSQSDSRYEALLEATLDPAFILDATTGEIRGVNRACERLLDKPAGTLIGTHHTRLYPPEQSTLYQDAIAGSQGERKRITTFPDGSQPTVVTDSGETIPIEMSVGRVPLPEGPILFVTFHKTGSNSEQSQLGDIADLLSHDSRNQLNLAQGRLESLGERHQTDIEHIEAAHDRIETLISEISTLAKGDPSKDPIECSLPELIEETWETIESDEGTLTVESTRTVRADESRLRELLEHLLQNAVDYAGPDVSVTAGDTENGFYIADDGPGVAPEDRDRIFEAGYSTRPERTGLGLTIVEEIAQAHGWGITIDDSDSGGARFEIIIPPRHDIRDP